MRNRLIASVTVFAILGASSCRHSLAVPLGGAVASVSVFPNPPSGQLQVGGSGDVEAVAYDTYGTVTLGKSVSFTTSDASVVRLDAGANERHRTAVARALGTAVITVVIDGIYGSTTLHIVP